MAKRADEIIRDTLKTNRASYSFLTLCGTNMFFDEPQKALASTDFPLLVCRKVGHSGSPRQLGSFDQKNRIPVQIDLYQIQNGEETVSAVDYYDTYLLKKIAANVYSCLRDHIKDNTGDDKVYQYNEGTDRAMGEDEFKKFPVVRRTLECDIQLYNAQ